METTTHLLITMIPVQSTTVEGIGYDANFKKDYRVNFNVLIRSVITVKDTVVNDKAIVKKDSVFLGAFYNKEQDFTITESNQNKNFIPKINYESNL